MPVTSREYKLVLKTKHFTGNQQTLIKKAQKFWTNFQNTSQPNIQTEGTLDTIEKTREIIFYDTPSLTLNNSSYILRQRTNTADNETEITLKCRHTDRYVSQDRNMTAKAEKAKIKFEEDIKTTFEKLYSHSSTQKIKEDTPLTTLKHIAKLYPGLPNDLHNFNEHEPISPINKKTINEIVITGADFHFEHDPAIDIECGLIVWYDTTPFEDDPIIVEFSFRYGNKKEEYSHQTALQAHKLFLHLQKELEDWIDKDNPTKTGFIFNNT